MFPYYHSSAFSGGLTYRLTHNQLIKGRNREREDIIYTNLKFSDVTRMSSHCYVCKRNKLNSLLNTESLINCKQRCRLSMVRRVILQSQVSRMMFCINSDVITRCYANIKLTLNNVMMNACLLPLKSRLSAFVFLCFSFFVIVFLCVISLVICVCPTREHISREMCFPQEHTP